jgi:peptide/nickel transport system permease protein
MIRFLLRRLLLLLPTVWFIMSVVFLLSRVIPGTFQDRWVEAGQSMIGGPAPAQQAIGGPGEEDRDKPLFYFSLHSRPGQVLMPVISWQGIHNQYHAWLVRLLHGDLGYSYRDRQPVLTILGEAIGNTLLLLVLSLVFTFFISIELALALMAESGRPWRRLVLSLLFILDSVPLFLVALLLLVGLAGTGYLSWFPLFGLGYNNPGLTWGEAFINRLHHLLLPGICLVISGMPYVTTTLYRVMQQVAGSAFAMTARAKGLPAKVVLRRHVLRNAVLPLITLFTGFLPSLISGAVVVEVIFALPGTGRLLADSVLARDYPVVLGLVFLLAALKAAAHLLADFLYFTADPRTRLKIL